VLLSLTVVGLSGESNLQRDLHLSTCGYAPVTFTSRILEGWRGSLGLVERRIGDWLVGWSRPAKKAPAVTPPGLKRDDATAASCQPRGKTIRIRAVAQYRAMAAGVTDRLWGIGDMVNVLEEWEATA
jgi:hypothetical protein